MPNLGEPLAPSHVTDIFKLRNVLLQVLDQLAYLAMRSYCHMDLRLPNILIKDGKATLIDFDHSRLIDDTNQMSQEIPSSPPERSISHTSDMWSFGLIVWRLVGTSECSNPSRDDIRNVTENLKIKNNFQKQCEQIHQLVQGCLTEDPNQRLTIEQAQDLISKWQREISLCEFV